MTEYANKDIFGPGGDGQNRLLVAAGDPIPADVTVDAEDKEATRSAAVDLPIVGYEALSEGDILSRLSGLSAANLVLVKVFESAGEARASILRFGDGGELRIYQLNGSMPASATAVDADQVIGEVPAAGAVVDVTYVPEAVVTGVDSNTRAVRLVNKGAAGTGAVVVATLTFALGNDAVAFDEKTVPLTSTLADRAVAVGDILAWESEAVASGLADPGGLVTVKIATG